jgi:phage terminase small subunit
MENYLKLPARLKRFAEAIAEGRTAAEAVRLVRPRARCPKQQGWRWKQIPQVGAAIRELEQLTAEEAGITRLQVLLDAKEIKLRCMTAEPVRDRDGKPTGEYQFDSAGANRANELLAKACGVVGTERVELTGKNGTPLLPRGVDDLTDEELAAIAAGGRPAPAKPPAGPN